MYGSVPPFLFQRQILNSACHANGFLLSCTLNPKRGREWLQPIGGALELGTNTVNGMIATPGTIINMTKDGPSIRDTPTMQKIANLKMPTVESLTRTFTGKKEDVSQAIDEIAHTTERSNNVGKGSL